MTDNYYRTDHIPYKSEDFHLHSVTILWQPLTAKEKIQVNLFIMGNQITNYHVTASNNKDAAPQWKYRDYHFHSQEDAVLFAMRWSF